MISSRPSLVIQTHHWQTPHWTRRRTSWRLCLGWVSIVRLSRELTRFLAAAARELG